MPFSFGAKSSIQLFVFATQAIASFAQTSLASRSANLIVALEDVVRRPTSPACVRG